MAFGNINSSNSINLKNIKKYTANNNASNVFKKKFYANIDINDVDAYEDINNQYSIDIAKTQTSMEEQVNQKLAELEKLYKARDDNNGLFNPIKEAEIEEKILQLEKELNVEHRPDGFERFLDDPLVHVQAFVETTKAHIEVFVVSTVQGVASVGENIIDGAIMLGGGAASYVVGIFDEETANSMQNWIRDVVSYDACGAAYDAYVNARGIDKDIAYGFMHKSGCFVGKTGATIALQFVPGGAAVMMSAHGLRAMGETAQSEFTTNENATFNKVFAKSAINGAIEAGASGILYGKTKAGNKVIDNTGKWIHKKLRFDKAGQVLSNWANNKGISTGIKNYAKDVFKPSLTVKEGVAFLKEHGKELANLPLDGDYDWKKASIEGLKSMATTTVNELVVSPITNKATKQEMIKDKKKAIEAANEMKQSNSDLNLDITGIPTGYYEHAMAKLNTWEIIVENSAVNKFAKKVGTEVQKPIYSYLEKLLVK